MRDRLIPKEMKADIYNIFDDEPKLKLPDNGQCRVFIGRAWAKDSKKKCNIHIHLWHDYWNEEKMKVEVRICKAQRKIHQNIVCITEEEVIPHTIQMIDSIIKTFQEPASTCSLCNKLMLSGPLGNICKDNDLHCEECVFRC